MTYRVLKPVYEKTGEVTHLMPSGVLVWESVRWLEVGFVQSMREAKERFGGSPVLEYIRTAKTKRRH